MTTGEESMHTGNEYGFIVGQYDGTRTITDICSHMQVTLSKEILEWIVQALAVERLLLVLNLDPQSMVTRGCKK